MVSSYPCCLALREHIGYTDHELEDWYDDYEQIKLLIHRKRNLKRPDEAWQRFLKKPFRMPIDTAISQIETLFSEKIHAVTAKGFLLKVFLFVLAYAVDQAYVSSINLST